MEKKRKKRNRTEPPQQKETATQILRILEDRGSEALEMARKTVLAEEIESKEAREAMSYFMTEYWHDLARPALLSLACEAVGGDPCVTTPIAVPMSLISGAIDIHDDIIDQSKTKGSHSTVLGKFGENIALLVGDALLFKGFSLLYEAVKEGIPAETIAIIVDVIKGSFIELGDAEALELKFRGRLDVTPEEYLSVVRKKATDVRTHTYIGAFLGGGSKEETENLSEYGRLLGILILLRDDFIDMIDLEEAAHRIKNEHLPLPILYALQSPAIKSTLSPLLRKNTITKKDAEKILTIVGAAKGFDRMGKYMEELVQDAYKKIEAVQKKKPLALLVEGMLLPDWRSFARATKI